MVISPCWATTFPVKRINLFLLSASSFWEVMRRGWAERPLAPRPVFPRRRGFLPAPPRPVFPRRRGFFSAPPLVPTTDKTNKAMKTAKPFFKKRPLPPGKEWYSPPAEPEDAADPLPRSARFLRREFGAPRPGPGRGG